MDKNEKLFLILERAGKELKELNLEDSNLSSQVNRLLLNISFIMEDALRQLVKHP